jgi:hypothetical protein
MGDQRRSLTEGITPPLTTAETEFLQAAKSSNDGTKAMQNAAAIASGVSLSTRIHPDIRAALQQASLKRKLKGIVPNSLRDILEEAVTPWLKANGYLP